MKLAFLGTPEFAVPSLRALARAGHDVRLVVTNPDRPRGRSGEPAPPPVKAAALELGLAVEQPVDPRAPAFVERLRSSGAELGVVVAYGAYLVKAVRQAPSLGYMINLHASLLPRWRGAAPVLAAIRAGDAVSGVSIQRVEAKLDGGPVCASREEPIRPDDTRASLEERLRELGAALLVETVARLERGEATFAPQDETRVTTAPELAKDDGRIDWTRPAVELERLVRAMTPWPLATCAFEGKRLIVVRAAVGTGKAPPGEVVAVEKESVVVGTGEGALALATVRPEGKQDMSAAAWARGRRLVPGARLA